MQMILDPQYNFFQSCNVHLIVPMPRTLLLLSCLLAWIWQNSSAATLNFETKKIETTLEPDAKTKSIAYRFENKTEEAIEIAEIATQCTCISVKFKDDKKIYKPGEKGEVVADFEVGDLSGTVEKEVVVWLKGDPRDKPSIILTAAFTIPELVAVTPRTLTWEMGGPATPKSYNITVTHAKPVHLTGVTCNDANFGHELKTIRDGWEYELIVRPAQASQTSFGIFNITTDCDVARFARITAFAVVRQALSEE